MDRFSVFSTLFLSTAEGFTTANCSAFLLLHDNSRVRYSFRRVPAFLEHQIERLQRTNLKILAERDRTTDLEVYVDERREWERASWLTRQKWELFGWE